MRWTTLVLAVAIAGCAKGERDQASQSAAGGPADSSMAADTMPADTSAMGTSTMPETADTLAPKKAASGGATETKSAKSDTAKMAHKAEPNKTGATPTTGPSGAEAMMGVRATGVAARTLSTDQVKQLQAALKKDGCYSGTPDGVSGPGTQRAIECGLKKYKLKADDMNGLYKKLGLKY